MGAALASLALAFGAQCSIGHVAVFAGNAMGTAGASRGLDRQANSSPIPPRRDLQRREHAATVRN